MTKIPATKISVIKPDSDPSEIITAITALVSQLGTSMLTDVSIHTAELKGTDVEEEFKTFSTKIDEVANAMGACAEQLYADRDEMLGTMVLASLLTSVRLMNKFEEACDEVEEDQDDEVLQPTEADGFEFNVPDGMGFSTNGGKHGH